MEKRKFTGHDYADLIAAYLTKRYEHRDMEIYREVSLGKTIIGRKRQMDILIVHRATGKGFSIECKYQGVQGTADEKIPYALKDIEATPMPACLIYAGEGFSPGILHMLQAHPQAAFAFPDAQTLESSKRTRELDAAIAMNFDWWNVLLGKQKTFDLAAWKEKAGSEVSIPPPSHPDED